MPRHPVPTPASPRLERAFSLVEVIVAMTVLSIVVSGFALAVASGERAGGRERVNANKAAIAKKAHAQLQGNVDAQSHCGQQWSIIERESSHEPASTEPVPYDDCNWPASGTWRLVDEDGRSYNITAVLRAVDDPIDGTGMARSLDRTDAGGDADFDTRDRIDLTLNVQLAADSTTGLTVEEAASTYVLRGQTDWVSSDTLGTARVMVCVLDRPDRAMANGRCVDSAGGEDQPAQPVDGVQITLTPVDDGTAFSATSSAGIASFNGVLPNGTYGVTVTAGLGTRTLFRYAPAAITISGSDPQEATVYLARRGSTFEVCGRITNPDNFGFGWKVTQATLSWAALGAPLHKTARLAGMSDSWRCVAQAITDPLGYSNQYLYRGRYVLEISQVNPHLQVTSAGPCATGNDATWSLYGGTIADPAVLTAGSFRRGLDFTDRNDANARMCIEFYSSPIEALDCVEGDPGCVLIDRICSPASCAPAVDCWNCGTIPVRPVSAYPHIGPAGVHNGPNESNVACRNRQDVHSWSTANLYYAGTARSPRSNWQHYGFLGVNNLYQAQHPDGAWNNCAQIAFTMTRSITNTCGSYSLSSPCTGPDPWSLGDCIEAEIAGRVVRGMLRDTFIAGQPSLGVMIGGWDRFIDHPNVDIDWHSYSVSPNIAHTHGTTSGASPTWMNGWPRIRWTKVVGDPICQSSSQPVDEEDKIQDVVPATIVDVYKAPGPDDVDDPFWPVPGAAQLAPSVASKSL
jgi:prepilin-type N-terminal cleavage/methylation domain-containing protein